MKLFHAIRSRKGISLAEVMVALALLGMAGVLLNNMISGYLNSKTLGEFNHITKNFGLELSRSLGNPANCGTTFSAGNISSLDLSSQPTITAITDFSGTPIYSIGPIYAEGAVKITGIRVHQYTPGAAPDWVAGAIVLFDLEYLKKTPSPPQISWAFSANVRTESSGPGAGHVVVQQAGKAVCASGVVDRGFVLDKGDTMIGPLAIDLPRVGGPTPIAGDPCLLGAEAIGVCVADATWFGTDRKGILAEDGFIQTDMFYMDSDERLKTKIHPLRNSLEFLHDLEGRSFQWKQSQLHDWGFIAQDLEKHSPELVHRNPKNDRLSVAYLSLLAHQIEAIHSLKDEQLERIEDLKRVKVRLARALEQRRQN